MEFVINVIFALILFYMLLLCNFIQARFIPKAFHDHHTDNVFQYVAIFVVLYFSAVLTADTDVPSTFGVAVVVFIVFLLFLHLPNYMFFIALAALIVCFVTFDLVEDSETKKAVRFQKMLDDERLRSEVRMQVRQELEALRNPVASKTKMDKRVNRIEPVDEKHQPTSAAPLLHRKKRLTHRFRTGV